MPSKFVEFVGRVEGHFTGEAMVASGVGVRVGVGRARGVFWREAA